MIRMMYATPLTLATLIAILSCRCIVTPIQAKNHITETQALTNLYKAKQQRKDDSLIDVGEYVALRVVEEDEDRTGDGNDRNYKAVSQKRMKKRDKITYLPGQPPNVEFDQYGGYVTTNSSAGRALFYYFVEAHYHSKHSLPLLLWLNGGPGCSSLGYGAMQELGPFRVQSDGKTLFQNKYAWNNEANLLFLESPAGVGFSYSNTTSDYTHSGDQSTAADNYMFLVNWLERFPEYKRREFYISGESYAGHYVPQLAHQILLHNRMAGRTIINLKGIIIGNAVINDETDTKGMYAYWTSHALVSDEVNDRVNRYCDFSPSATKERNECSSATQDAENCLYNLDIYNIYAPLCSDANLTARPKRNSVRVYARANIDDRVAPVLKVQIKSFDPCSDSYVHEYMNRPDVQAALHANVTKLTHDWSACSDVISNWRDSPSSVLPLLQEFMDNDLRVWVFSGDTDGRVPVTSTKYSIEQMKLPIKTPWHAWLLNKEVGGFVQEYEGDITVATVRGAGHQVPSYRPAQALSLIAHFLRGSPLPGPSS